MYPTSTLYMSPVTSSMYLGLLSTTSSKTCKVSLPSSTSSSDHFSICWRSSSVICLDHPPGRAATGWLGLAAQHLEDVHGAAALVQHQPADIGANGLDQADHVADSRIGVGTAYEIRESQGVEG